MTQEQAQEEFLKHGGNTDLIGKLMQEDEELWGMPHQKWTDEVPEEDRKFLGFQKNLKKPLYFSE